MSIYCKNRELFWPATKDHFLITSSALLYNKQFYFQSTLNQQSSELLPIFPYFTLVASIALLKTASRTIFTSFLYRFSSFHVFNVFANFTEYQFPTNGNSFPESAECRLRFQLCSASFQFVDIILRFLLLIEDEVYTRY